MKTWQLLKAHPELWPRYFIRETVIRSIRSFFDQQNFHEIEAPILISHPPAESYLDVFETTLLDRNRKSSPAYLSTSPEVPLKKLMVAGLGDCYSLTKSFRNMETNSSRHQPEFTILEWYRVGAKYEQIMVDCEQLLLHINSCLKMSSRPPSRDPEEDATGFRVPPSQDASEGRSKPGMTNIQSVILPYQGQKIDLAPPWERLTVVEAFARYSHIYLNDFFDLEVARKIAAAKGYQVSPHNTWEELYNQIFLNEIEPKLGFVHPTILYEFPAAMGALAKLKASDPRYAERFEFYIAGLELGDCYSELTDPIEQERRFKAEMVELKRLGKTTYDYDHDFIAALKAGLPDCSGIAIGVDRLVMLFANAKKISDTLFFPTSEEF